MSTASMIKVGDTVLPPPRELSLWMRRHIKDNGLSEAALHLTVTEVYGTADKGGEWVVVKATYSTEWCQGRPTYAITFKARPATPWKIIATAQLAT